MKTPSIDLQALNGWLVRNGEKLVVSVVGIGAILLVWGGVQAVRSLSVTESQAPQALEQAVARAGEHITRDRAVPAELRPPRALLADAIDPWRNPTVPWKRGDGPGLRVPSPEPVALLNRPLFEELAKRTQPAVLPIEDLRAVAGIALLPAAARPAGPGGLPRPPAARPARPSKPDAAAGRRPPRGGDPLEGRTDPTMLPVDPPAAEDAGPTGRIAPYVIVTGLIPVAKQQEEYRERFESSGFPDPQRDSPKWSDFEIDRGLVAADGKVVWTTIDLAAVSKRIGVAGAAAGDAMPADLRLDVQEEKRSKQTPLDFCGSVPTRIDGGWELADLHPWVVDWMARKLTEEEQRREAQPRDMADSRPGGEGPGFGVVEEQPGGPGDTLTKPDLPPFRLFRFVDMDVEPGRTYRYRVRLKVWNPNWDENPERMRPQLADPSLALEPKLSSPDAETSVVARVPDTTRILVGTLRTDEIKDMRLKPGTLEVFVLAPGEQTGSFALRGFVADPGAVIEIDEKFNARNQHDRCRGERLVTGSVLLDAVGRQEERDRVDEKGRPVPLAEPFAVICLKKDGSFEVASVDGSARDIAEHRRTLPPRLTKSGAAAPGAGDDLRTDPAVDLLTPPGGVR